MDLFTTTLSPQTPSADANSTYTLSAAAAQHMQVWWRQRPTPRLCCAKTLEGAPTHPHDPELMYEATLHIRPLTRTSISLVVLLYGASSQDASFSKQNLKPGLAESGTLYLVRPPASRQTPRRAAIIQSL